jgi:hypothetical protein
VSTTDQTITSNKGSVPKTLPRTLGGFWFQRWIEEAVADWLWRHQGAIRPGIERAVMEWLDEHGIDEDRDGARS